MYVIVAMMVKSESYTGCDFPIMFFEDVNDAHRLLQSCGGIDSKYMKGKSDPPEEGRYFTTFSAPVREGLIDVAKHWDKLFEVYLIHKELGLNLICFKIMKVRTGVPVVHLIGHPIFELDDTY